MIQDAEAWLRNGSQLTGEELQAAKAKFERTLISAKDDLIRLEEAVVEKTKEAAKATDEYVQENPWKAVGIGAAARRGRSACSSHANNGAWRSRNGRAHRRRPWSPWCRRGWNWPRWRCEEESQRFLGYLVLALLSLILFGIAMVLVALADRCCSGTATGWRAVGALAALFGAAGTYGAFQVKRSFAAKPRLLAATVAELKRTSISSVMRGGEYHG